MSQKPIPPVSEETSELLQESDPYPVQLQAEDEQLPSDEEDEVGIQAFYERRWYARNENEPSDTVLVPIPVFAIVYDDHVEFGTGKPHFAFNSQATTEEEVIRLLHFMSINMISYTYERIPAIIFHSNDLSYFLHHY